MIRAVFALLAVVTLTNAQYVGCFNDHRGDRDMAGANTYFSGINKLSVCQEYCMTKGYKYAGMQDGDQCNCGDSFGKHGKADDKECNRPCPFEKTQSCGGSRQNSVFLTDYVGCWKDSETRSLPEMTNMGYRASIEACIRTCEEEDYKFAGVQSGNLCFCGHDYNKYGEVDRSECDKPCQGNRNQMCGGVWRNSVFKTGACKKCASPRNSRRLY